jgi:signal transduction histidine kinase
MEMRRKTINSRQDREQKVLLEISHAFSLLGSWEWDLTTDEVFWTDGTFKLRAAPVTSVNLPTFEEALQHVHKDDQQLVTKKFKALHQQKELSFEYRNILEDGTVRVIKLVSHVVKDDAGMPLFLQVTSQDVTKERQLSSRLEQKNRELEKSNNDLASFSYVASHDLQEPLRKIQTFSHRILETEWELLSEQGKNYFKRMEQAAMRMQKLIEDLLSFSRTNSAPKAFEEVDLNEMLVELKSTLKDSIEEKQAIVEHEPLPKLKVIPFQFKQLFENLLLNSLKYSKPEVPPRISIKSEVVNGDDPEIRAAMATKTFYKISVTDNGIGFDEQYAEKIFEMFQRLHGKHEYPGSGLGLSICKKVVENHHGFITAHSHPGEGATFTLILPQ